MIKGSFLRELASKIVVGLHRPVFERFRQDCLDPQTVSEVTLKRILSSSSQLAKGLFPGLGQLSEAGRTVSKKLFYFVPLTNYEFYSKRFEELKANNALMHERDATLRMFALTSGTTGNSKFIPVNSAFLNAYRRAWKLWGYSAFTAHPQAATGSFLQFSGSWQRFRTESGIWCGAMSGLTMAMQPSMVRKHYVLPAELAAVNGVKDRYYLAALRALRRDDVSFICTANPQTLVNFMNWANDRSEDLIRDLHDGTISLSLELEEKYGLSKRKRSALARTPTPDRERSLRLESIFAKDNSFTPAKVWPRLSLVSVWTGGSMSHFLPSLRIVFGNVPIRDPGFMATEGYFALPISDESSDGVLNIWGHYFEFIPYDQTDKKYPSTIEAHELTVGSDYELVVSSDNGLLRYRMNDIIRCTGFWGATPLIRFLHKGKDISNLAGEKLSAFQVSRALGDISSLAPGLNLRHAVLVGQRDERRPYYILKHSWTNHSDEIAAKLDGFLQNLNEEYEDRRKTDRLGPIVLERVSESFFQNLESDHALRAGFTAEQQKLPVLLTLAHHAVRG